MAPHLVPYRKRLSAWLQTRYRAMMDRNRRIVGRPLRLIGRPLPNVVSAGAGGVSAAGFQATGIVSISEEAPIEQKVEYLLRREQEAQRKMDASRGD